MNKKIKLGTAVALILFAALIAFALTYVYVNRIYQEQIGEYNEYTQMYEKLYNFDKIIRSEYIGKINDDELMDGILKGYMYGLGDKYGEYYNDEEYSKLSLQMSGQMVGIGVTVQFNEEASAMEIVGVIENSPASGAGLAVGDLITKVADCSVATDGYSETVAAISGNEGDPVLLTVIKKDTGLASEISIARAVVSYSSVSCRIYQNYIGIISISEFNSSTASEFKECMRELKENNIGAYIFDVRNNLGGDLDSVCEILDYILPEGPIVRLLDAHGNETSRQSGTDCIEGQICVLTNKYTASAAELFASAIRDYKYGTLVGTRTYGKGTAQTIKKFADQSGVRLSTELYMPPYGDNYEGIGIAPDIEVEYEAGSDGNEDSQLTAAIKNINDKFNQIYGGEQ